MKEYGQAYYSGEVAYIPQPISTGTVLRQVIYMGLGFFGWLVLTENREGSENVSDTTHTYRSTAARNTILASIYMRVFIGGPLLVYQAHCLLDSRYDQIARIAAANYEEEEEEAQSEPVPFTGSMRNGKLRHSECCQTLTMRLLMFCQIMYGLCDILQAYISDYEGPVVTNNVGIGAGFDGHGEVHENLAHCMVAFLLISHFLYFYLLISTGNGIRATTDNTKQEHESAITHLSCWLRVLWELGRILGIIGIGVTLMYSIYVSVWLVVNFLDINWLDMEWKLPTSIGLLYVFTSLAFR